MINGRLGFVIGETHSLNQPYSFSKHKFQNSF